MPYEVILILSCVICKLLVSSKAQLISNPCPFNDFRCGDGSACLRVEKLCNGIVDCANGEDESGNGQWDCSQRTPGPTCRSNQFKCRIGGCINNDQKCDGIAQCWGGSDESIEICKNAHPRPRPGGAVAAIINHPSPPVSTTQAHLISNPCHFNDFRCGDGSACLRTEKLCNGIIDCANGEDEYGNKQWDCSQTTAGSTCRSNQFKCRIGGCVNNDQICDGIADCWGGSDESIEICKNERPKPRPTEFTTTSTTSQTSQLPPISTSHHLHHHHHHEAHLIPKACSYNEFRCSDGSACLRAKKLCNGVDDCANGEDEYGNKQWDCSKKMGGSNCRSDQFKCRIGGCINADQKCDGIAQCWGGSDESIEICTINQFDVRVRILHLRPSSPAQAQQ